MFFSPEIDGRPVSHHWTGTIIDDRPESQHWSGGVCADDCLLARISGLTWGSVSELSEIGPLSDYQTDSRHCSSKSRRQKVHSLSENWTLSVAKKRGDLAKESPLFLWTLFVEKKRGDLAKESPLLKGKLLYINNFNFVAKNCYFSPHSFSPIIFIFYKFW